MRDRYLQAAGLALALFLSPAGAEIRLDHLQLPEGYAIEVFADDVENARQMALGENGTIFVGSRRAGKVHAVIDDDGDHRADRVVLIDQALKMPSGVAFRDGDLYVAAVGDLYRYDDIEANLDAPPERVLVTDRFPTDEHHGWKHIEFGPDGKLYVPIGAPCNICLEEGYARIVRIDADGSGEEVVAELRNSVGFDFDPVTGDLWFTDNGRDMLGDNLPPCELNHVSEIGQHFGYPFWHGGLVRDPAFGGQRPYDEFRAPAQQLMAHVALLGMLFYRGGMLPDDLENDILVAEHGSWNRTTKSGYRVMRARLDGEREVVKYEPFISGWLQGEQSWGRPVDLLQLPDGSVLISDDQAGAIYRVRRAEG